MTYCCGRTSTILADLFGPEFIAHRNMKGTYRRYPIGARVGAGLVVTVTGLLKPFLLPLIAAIGLILMPIMAGVAAEKGDVEGTKGYFKAWGLCALVIVGTVTFLAVATFYMPLLYFSSLMIGIVALSIICHVQKAMKEPGMY